MPAYTKPFGLQPIQLLGGQVYAGSTREYPIASTYGTALRPGDIVKITSGTISKETGTTAVTATGVLGVFLGCSYTDAVLGKTFRQNWTAGTVATDAVAIVADDRDTVFRAAYVSGTTVISSQTYAAVVGKNVALVQNTTSTTTSDVAVSGIATTATLPLRVVDVDKASVDSSGNYTAVLLRWNFGMHANDLPTGA
jgi:hypothetical protein